MMSKSNCEKPEPVHNLFRIIAKGFEVRGFIVSRNPQMKENFGKQQDDFKTIKLGIMKISLKVSKRYHKHWLMDTKIKILVSKLTRWQICKSINIAYKYSISI